ncbi:hypothetical protein DL96DRAFT_1620913 [Flagelloscypha sp. PMI_526]|nr:hypothetical protein DL96DRAFT_1620913 [Flagelloscypha sp. PMI_526]
MSAHLLRRLPLFRVTLTRIPTPLSPKTATSLSATHCQQSPLPQLAGPSFAFIFRKPLGGRIDLHPEQVVSAIAAEVPNEFAETVVESVALYDDSIILRSAPGIKTSQMLDNKEFISRAICKLSGWSPDTGGENFTIQPKWYKVMIRQAPDGNVTRRNFNSTWFARLLEENGLTSEDVPKAFPLITLGWANRLKEVFAALSLLSSPSSSRTLKLDGKDFGLPIQRVRKSMPGSNSRSS